MANQFYSEFPERGVAADIKKVARGTDAPNTIETSQTWKTTKDSWRTSTGKDQVGQASYKPTEYKCSTKKGDAYPYGIGDKPSDWRVSSNKKQPSGEHYGNEKFPAKGDASDAFQVEPRGLTHGWGRPASKNPSAPNKGAKRAPRKGSATTPPALGGGY